MSLKTYLAEHPKKHLIFDLDHTLARLEIDWRNIHSLLFEEIKDIDPSLAINLSTNAREFYSLINTAVKKHGASAKQRTRLFIERFEQAHYSHYTPNTELLPFIRTHARDYSFSIWTSNTKNTIQDFLSKESLAQVFNPIVTLNDVEFSKPHSDGFYKIYDPTKSKKEYLMIGDSENDEEAAKQAGIDFFKVTYWR